MKAVMVSINPKWCEKIASGEKTIEVRKTRPKMDTPFKCYIYCTKPKEVVYTGKTFSWGKEVIGEFVCDRIYDITPHCDIPTFVNQYECDWKYGEAEHCLSFDELKSYLNTKRGYGWHISDLVIYEQPKELSEFEHDCNGICLDFKKGIVCEKAGIICNGLSPLTRLTRPPMSWCYVEDKEKHNGQRRND